MVAVDLVGVTVHKNGVAIISDIDLSAEPGRVLGLVGPSGGGKTSILRTIAGLDRPTTGGVRFDGVDVTDTEPGERDVAMVFEKPALYPHRSVRGNIAFPLEMRHDDVETIRARVGAEARALHIENLLSMSPRRLSAGEAHVVQVARAMVRNAAVLLLDEPFANLDDEQATQLRREVMLIQRGFGATTLLATNDPLDAMTMADRLAVVERGRVTQVGTPIDVYLRPSTVAASLVTGDADVLEVRVEADRDAAWLVHDGFRLRAWQPALRRHATRRLQLVVRPEWWQLDAHGPVTLDVERVHGWGATIALWCRAGNRPLTVKLPSPLPRPLREGDRVSLRLERYVLIDPIDGFELDLS
jgi:ABC-type sugar transport system ATPase subunit